ncbi:MAG TPA: hypothetical protein DC047_03250 [Blastocatellia bacterium]|nr:hypothetical protein [Blastocatellia bacterium]
MKLRIWNLESGIWNLESGIWNFSSVFGLGSWVTDPNCQFHFSVAKPKDQKPNTKDRFIP